MTMISSPLTIKSPALRITFIYFTVASIWIFASDELFSMVFRRLEDFAYFSILKGLLFVIVTALFLYSLIRKYFSELEQSRKSLAESEERFQMATRGTNDGIWDYDKETGQAYYSPRWKEMLGYADNELANAHETWEELIHPGDRETVQTAMAEVLEDSSTTYEVEFRMRHKDGHYLNILSRGLPIRNDEGKLTRIVGTHVDITQRKTHEKEIGHLNKIYVTLSRISQLVFNVRSRAELFGEACRIIIENTDYCLVWIGLVDPETRQVVPMGKAGRDRGYLDRITVFTDDSPRGRGPTGICIRDKKPCIFNNFSEDLRALPWKEAALAHGINSTAAFPIRFSDEVIGALMVYADETGSFGDKEISLLNQITSSISYTLDHLNLEKERQQAELILQRQADELHMHNEELSRFNRVAVGREIRMIELKHEINELTNRLGESPRYPLEFIDHDDVNYTFNTGGPVPGRQEATQ